MYFQLENTDHEHLNGYTIRVKLLQPNQPQQQIEATESMNDGNRYIVCGEIKQGV